MDTDEIDGDVAEAIDVCTTWEAVAGDQVDTGPFGRADVERIVAEDVKNGDYAETDVVAVLLLRDGRFAFISGSCDTSGWG